MTNEIHTKNQLLAILEKYPSALAAARKISETPIDVPIEADDFDIDMGEVEALARALDFETRFFRLSSPKSYHDALVKYMDLVEYRSRPESWSGVVQSKTQAQLFEALEKYPTILEAAHEIVKMPDNLAVIVEDFDICEDEALIFLSQWGLDVDSFMQTREDAPAVAVAYIANIVAGSRPVAPAKPAKNHPDLVGRETKAQLFEMLERYPNLPAVARGMAEVAMIDHPEMDELEVSSLAFELALDADTWMGSAAAAQELVAAYFEAIEYEKELEYHEMFE